MRPPLRGCNQTLCIRLWCGIPVCVQMPDLIDMVQICRTKLEIMVYRSAKMIGVMTVGLFRYLKVV